MEWILSLALTLVVAMLGVNSAPPSTAPSAQTGTAPTVVETATTSPSVVQSTTTSAAVLTSDLDGAFFDATVRDRGSSLEWSSALADYAWSHLRRVEGAGLFHSSDAELASVGGEFVTVGENLGVGWSVEQIQTALMRSPTHRENVTWPTFTHFGSASQAGDDGRIWTVHIYGEKS